MSSSLPVLTYAFLGDAVYAVLARAHLIARHGGRPGALHEAAAALVSAHAQAQAAARILPLLTEEERGVFLRGRNAKTAARPKGGTAAEYHLATALETLLGWLYHQGAQARARELFALSVAE